NRAGFLLIEPHCLGEKTCVVEAIDKSTHFRLWHRYEGARRPLDRRYQAKSGRNVDRVSVAIDEATADLGTFRTSSSGRMSALRQKGT
ncbi:MAG TPA: hypothetical protein VK512_14075, partial [Xanthobacteraceae bacterium]|nr:hypothetical protein [Xanthobacteraceae bacterium]